MSWVWSWNALPGLAVFLIGTALALFVFTTRPDRIQNRLLALLILVESVYAGSGGAFMYLTDQPTLTWAFQALTLVLLLAMPAIYMLFLSTVSTPLVRPLASRRARWALGAVAVVSTLPWFVAPDHFLVAVRPGAWAPWGVAMGPGWRQMQLVFGLVGLFGLVVAVSALRVAPPSSTARDQARAYVAAFGVRDVGLAIITLGPWITTLPGWADPQAWAAVVTAYFLLLAYGMLRTQLFGIDLKIKWTLKQSTVAATFLAVIFLVSEGAQLVFGEDRAWLGLVAGGALVFAMAPLQRLAERVSDAAMPGVRDTEEYRTVRKREVYEAALEEALADGELTPKDRAVLAALQDHLGLTARDAVEMERQATATREVA